MSRAEEFIKAKTRIGSNTTKGWRRNGVSIPSYSLPWLTPDQARSAVEIAREEVIEKAIKWVEYNNENGGCKFDGWVEDIKQAMKDGTTSK